MVEMTRREPPVMPPGQAVLPDPAAATAPALVLAQARQRPDAVAVRQWSQQLTYHQLVSRALALAVQLRERGAGPERYVGVCLARTPDAVVAVLGVLFSGAAYVPLDLGQPRQRCLDMLADAGASLVVADGAGQELLVGQESLAGRAPFAAVGVACLPVPGPATPLAELAQAGAGPAGPDNVAHVIYTSGSTGVPKGVVTTHRNVADFVGCARKWFPALVPPLRTLAANSFGFDAVSYDLYVTLSYGGCIMLVGDSDRADPARLQRFAAEHRATWGVITPAVLGLLDPAELPDLAVVGSGGDVVPPELVGRWTSHPGRHFFNLYGPTEVTVSQTCASLRGQWREPLPIGQALPGHQTYVLDEAGRPVADGAVGELYVGGIGVARGYLHRPGITAQAFLPDPFVGRPGARMYRTGDMVRVLPTGDLAYLGRRDGQLKVRGQRIELGEIEAVLRVHPRVHDAAVVPVAGPSGIELAAFVTPAGAPPRAELREYVAQRLPAAMVPRWVVSRSRLPVAPNGKLDRTRLRELATELTVPATGLVAEPAERVDTVADLWQQVLGGPAPLPAEDFFGSGGHSIAAMRLVAVIRERLGRDLSVEDVFEARTLAGLTQRVAAAAPLTGPELVGGHQPALAASQRRMWFLEQLAPQLTAYNIVFAERLRGALDVSALRAALTALAGRQDILRWRIPAAAGEPYAVCDPPGEVPLPVRPLAEPEVSGALAAAAANPFDLAAGPLWAPVLYRLGGDDHLLVIAFHHSIVDGWSQAQLYADLAGAYQAAAANPAAKLPALRYGYADYVAWLAGREERDGAADRGWWAEHLAGAPAVLDLPRDRPRPPVQSYAGELVSVGFGAALDASVRELARALGATAPQLVLAALGQALRRLTGGTDLVIGAVNADRQLAAMQPVVGFFIDIVPLRLRIDDNAGFAEAVRACQAEYLAATAHPAAPLEQIVDELRLPRDPGRSPLVQVIFNAYSFGPARLALPGVTATPMPVPPPGSPFDLTVYLLERDGTLALDLLYNRDLYDQVRLQRLGADLVALLAALVQHPDKPVGELAVPFRTDRVADPLPPSQPGASHPNPSVAAGAAGAAPATLTERLIAEVWRSVLDLPEVRATDNFFDVGGHSLALVAVQHRLAELLGRPVPVVDLFRYPSIRALAAHLDGSALDPELSRAAQMAAARRSRTRRRRPT